MLIFGQDYNVETRDRRERLTSLLGDATSRKIYMLRNYRPVVSIKENNLNIAEENFQI
jgi:hypothetical protein